MHLFTKSFIVGAISALPCSVSDWHEPTSPIVHGYQLQHLQVPSQENVKLRVAATCPAEMVEVDGMYCPNVAQECLQWINPTAKVKRMCAKFAPSKCLSKERIHMHYCMDKYEGQDKKGELPRVEINWWEAKQACEDNGKRLCNEDEFTFACEGENMKAYPYGDGTTRDDTACNAGKIWHDPMKHEKELDQRAPSGAYERCVSPLGINDIVANTDEWIYNTRGSFHKSPWVSGLMGGHWVRGVRNRCRAITPTHDMSTRFYEISYRCCSDVK